MSVVVAHLVLENGRAFSLCVARSEHLLRASLADVDRRRSATLVVADRQLPALLLEHADRALAEVLTSGRLPHPDIIADDFAGNRVDARELRVAFADAEVALTLAPKVAGRVVMEGAVHPVAHGVATCFEATEQDRILIHLDDGTFIDASEAAPSATWTSRYTFHDYAVAWRLQTAEADLELRATFPEQELVTATSPVPRWQGRAEVRGRVADRAVTGVAYVIARALPTAPYATIPRETERVIRGQFPLPFDAEHARLLLGNDGGRYARDVDPEEFQRVLIEPIREVLDRKGKAWRSYAAVVCYHASRGDPSRGDLIDVLLGMAEIIHAGSLIVDDVEDASPTRRGGPSCHEAHGVPIAINAGSFCYFAWQAWFARVPIPAEQRLRLYDLYFDFMRVAHLGQALDIQGFTRGMVDEIVVTGDASLLERQLHKVHLMKTGAPASVFARCGAIFAGVPLSQERALGDLFEALGLAFQIMDDVQNLKGFVGDPKHCEDLTQAKVTMPLIEALRVLPLDGRRDLWDRIGRCARETGLVPGIVETLDRAGAFTACRDRAHRVLEDAWRAAEPLIEDSIAKVMLRAFCLHVVDSLG